MLQQLHIQNYVLIEDLEILLSKGLTIITGETGAGKTILLGALSLILGQRADSAVLRDKQKKCIIEGHFDIKPYNLAEFFRINELDFEPVTSLRREISAEGKSRAFVNDTPVNLNQLKELGSKLVDIHSQHETLTLQNSGFQLQVVDSWCGHVKLLSAYQQEFLQFKKVEKEIKELTETENKSKADLDYFKFQFNELEQAGFIEGEQEILQQDLETLTHAEEIKSKVNQALGLIQDNDLSIINQLDELGNLLRPVTRYNTEINHQAERVKSSLLEIKDIASELSALDDQIVYDSEKINSVNERLNTIHTLQQKHRVSSIGELLKIKNQLAENLLKIDSLEEEIAKLKLVLEKSENELIKLSGQLNASRKAACVKIESEIKGMLTEVGMPHAQLKIELIALEHFNETGMDKARFLFSANKGGVLQELSKVASGGEMSRLMLVIKALMARLVTLPTIIFDEIDTGISGEIAFKVGSIIEKISSRHQVLAITHLPQMASRGDAHMLVYKKITGKTTHTGIKILDQQERIAEIAKMLSGDELTEAAIENAKELLSK